MLGHLWQLFRCYNIEYFFNSPSPNVDFFSKNAPIISIIISTFLTDNKYEILIQKRATRAQDQALCRLFWSIIKTDFDPKRYHKGSRAPSPLRKLTFFFSKHGYKSKYFVDFFGRLSIVTLLPKGASNAQAPYPEIWVCSLKTCLKYQALFWFFWPRTNRYLDVKRWNKGSRTPTPKFSEVDFSPSKRPKNIQRFSIFLVDNQQWFWS